MKREGGLEVTTERKETLLSFCFSCVKLLVWFTRKDGRSEVQKLVDVTFGACFDAEKGSQPVRKAEDRECLGTERPHDPWSMEEYRKDPTIASEGSGSSAIVFEETILDDLLIQTLSTASGSFINQKMF